ncbi:MAG: energy-coupling factor transporter transmembrane protein EcfT [Clostridiaceae bacterium]|jgi:energy-coupling factor transport system permease protein|nr:energy-coupling factor transporter transmembrane protein EcfT [Clostridiaceae bacterium]
MENRLLINLVPGDTFLHRLTGKTKVRTFIILLVYIIMSFDIRLIMPLLILTIIGLVSLKTNWKRVKYFIIVIAAVNLLNIVLFWLADPDIGSYWCGGGNTVLLSLTGRLFLSAETLWYLSVRFIKMITSFMVSLVFILSITPSEMAAGLYSIKVPYKICTIFSIAFRYIPDIARDFNNIKVSLQTRGVELDPKKASLMSRIKQNVLILVPLIITSFDRVGNISNAMDLRGFGRGKTRTYYSEHEELKADKVFKAIHIILLLFCAYWIITQNIMPQTIKMWYPFA